MTKVTTPNVHTVVIDLKRSYNPAFYTDDVLTEVPLLPQHAWDKTSLTGKVGNYDETTAGADAVWNFLQKQGSDIGTFTTNPMWQVVDGHGSWRSSRAMAITSGCRTRTTPAPTSRSSPRPSSPPSPPTPPRWTPCAREPA